MEIRIKALKCEAGEKLTQFVEKKVARLGKFFDGVAQQTKERQCRNRNDNDDNDVLDHCLAGAFDVGFFHSMLR